MSLAAKISQGLQVTGPLVLNALMAKMAEAAGFEAAYIGGGALGYIKGCLEANLNLTDVCQEAVAMRSVTSLSLVADFACGFGDPMHLVRSVGMAEASGIEAIEIEDQLMPKRAHHHVGTEHLVPCALMAAKVTEACQARRSKDFLIIARTNALRVSDMDDALRRGEAYRRAGADILLPALSTDVEQLRSFAKRLGGPLMYISGRPGFADRGVTLGDLRKLGYLLVLDGTAPVLLAYEAWKHYMSGLAEDIRQETMLKSTKADAKRHLDKEILSVIGIDRLLKIERETVEK